jgi:GNAT superfamily N-acetyltransferase
LEIKELVEDAGMYWRLGNKAYEACKGDTNKYKIKSLVKSGGPLGIIAYNNGQPVGWCSVSPRNALERLKTSRYFKRVDDAEVWSITCLYILPEYRKKGLSVELVREACAYAKEHGAAIIESYPIIPSKGKVPGVFAWVGFAHTFELVGFQQIKQPSESRSYMRYYFD